MAKNYFNIVDISVVLISLVTFLFDVVTDIIVCIGYLLDGHTAWGWLGITFIAVPAVLMSAFSLFWHIQDKTVTPVIVVSHLLLLAPAERYLKVAWLGLQAYRTQKVVLTQKAVRAESDASLLRLIEAFLESAPQLVLQLYILLCKERGNWMAGMSAGCSLVSLTWAMTTYCDTRCQARSPSCCRHILGLLVHWSWQLFMTAARIAAFVFFACAVHSWVFAVMGVHWLLSFVWISVRGTDFGTGYEKWLFRMACAFSYIFVFLNLNEGKSRWRVTAYYLLVLLENTGMLVVFLVMENNHMVLMSCLVVYVGFFIGVACMLIYYSLLHPSGSGKRLFHPRHRSSNNSRISRETDPHIFNIESPKPETSIEGATIQPSLAVSSSQSPASKAEKASHCDGPSGSAQHTSKATNPSKQTLQMAWQSGMQSSSDSSSSLASTENSSSLIKRTSSVKSDNSSDSASSDNQLLPQLVAKTSQSKSPKKTLTVEQLDYLKQVMPRSTANLNEQIDESSSPTLSKDSWATLSDQAMQLCVLGDFTVLGIDESSSTDKRVSDSSSFSSQQQSLSPLDALLLWKNSHVRLRSTIAATIAAATCNPTSDESTPSRSRYFSSSSGASRQDESSGHMKALSHSTTFVELCSSSPEQGSVSQRSSQDSSRHREALSALPDIIETFDHEGMSDFESRENSYEKSADEVCEDKATAMCADIVNACSSSYPVDSTLTLSKLETKKPRSYLASQRSGDIDCHGAVSSKHPYTAAAESSRLPMEHLLSTPDKKIACNGDSPFTDQELVTVMTKSLQNYIDGSSSVNSNNPEREGLALTLEDLRISRESTPESSPVSRKDGNGWKTRSTSSLFHDSTYSSPPSSASKMNRTESIQNAEAKLSPNAFKQIENLPHRLQCLDVLQKANGQAVATIQHSHALKFIMDSYASTALTSPCVAIPSCQNPANRAPSDTICQKPIPAPQRSSNRAPPDIISHKPTTQSRVHSQPLSYDMKEIIDLPSGSRPIDQNILQRRSIGNYPVDVNSYTKNTQSKELLDTTAWKRPHHMGQDQDVSDRAKDSVVRGGVSSTKKLNVYSGKLSASEYNKSNLYEQMRQEKGSDSEAGGYVSGQYCPPLCGSDLTDSKANSIQQNLDHERKGSKYDLNKISKPISELFSEDRKQNMNTTEAHILDPMKKEIVRRDVELKHRPIFYPSQHVENPHLVPKFHVCQSHPCGKCSSSAYPYDSANRTLQTLNQSAHKSPGHRSQTRSHIMDRMSEDELQMSAKHVAEYFSEALETSSGGYGCRPTRQQPLLQVHASRQPLQRLENSPHLSPGTNNYSIDNRRNMNNDPRNYAQTSRHHGAQKYATSLDRQRPDGEQRGQILRQYSGDFPKGRRLFECNESRSSASRPHSLNESRTTTVSRKSDKPHTKVRFSLETDEERYFQPTYHRQDQSSS